MMLFEQMEQCVFLHKVPIPDGEGSYTTEWREGEQFKASFTFDTSIQARIAEAQGVKGMYTVTVPKHVEIEYHTAFKRLSDDMIFRCVSKDDKKTPAAASFQVRQFNAEEWIPA